MIRTSRYFKPAQRVGLALRTDQANGIEMTYKSPEEQPKGLVELGGLPPLSKARVFEVLEETGNREVPVN